MGRVASSKRFCVKDMPVVHEGDRLTAALWVQRKPLPAR